MKVTKVERLRSGVSRSKPNGSRGILYETPKLKDETQSLENRLNNRIQDANRLYGVFFASDIPSDLEDHFQNIVKLVQERRTEDILKVLQDYEGYERKGKQNESGGFRKVSSFSYSIPEEKNLETVLGLHVRERMGDSWQSEKYSQAAVQVLQCVCCGRSYRELIRAIPRNTLDTFKMACLETSLDKYGNLKVYVPGNITGIRNVSRRNNRLEYYFSVLMEAMAKTCNKEELAAYSKGSDDGIERCLNRQEQWLLRLRSIKVKEGRESETLVKLQDIKWPYATQARLEAMLVRVRKPLKRESNAEIVIALMQGLAQMGGGSLHSAVEKLLASPDSRKKLRRFINSVNKNYCKTDILTSLRRMDVKVQVNSSGNAGRGLDLASVINEDKKALTMTLERYAMSEEASLSVLLDIKKLLFSYFPVLGNTEYYLSPACLWKFPKDTAVFFDDGFVPASTANQGREAGEPLEIIWRGYERKNRPADAKQRINYVNYGRYLECLQTSPDEFHAYWLKYIKEYVERHYTGKARISEQNCFSSRMLSECWTDIIQYLCGKFIDLGKAVYHFAMPQNMEIQPGIRYGELQERYQSGISSFDYEGIKAEETLQRDISVISVSANNAFSLAVLDEELRKGQVGKKNLEDILFLRKKQLKSLLKVDAVKSLLRFYGGESNVPKSILTAEGDSLSLVMELQSHLAAIRNENFHYTEGKKTKLATAYTEQLWRNDCMAFVDVVRKRYYSNNLAMFYGTGNLTGTVSRLYSGLNRTEGQVPAFRTIWKRRDLTLDINGAIKSGKYKIPDFLRKNNAATETRTIFENALYFLLKEIYYRDFVSNAKAAVYFYNAASAYEKGVQNDKKQKFPVQSFNRYIGLLREGVAGNGRGQISAGTNRSFAEICQMITREYNQQNAKEKDTPIYQHYKMLLPIYIKKAFWMFVKDHYGYVLGPKYLEIKGEQHYLDELNIYQMEFPAEEPELAAWYTFAHFVHPKQLNLLTGDFKNYLQYRQDILKREENASELNDSTSDKEYRKEVLKKTERVQRILDVLEFVRGISGRISACFEDYYTDRDAYARYLGNYIRFSSKADTVSFEDVKEFCMSTLADGSIVDIYADAENPKLLRNVELARMYAGGDIPLPGRKLVTGDEVRQYYNRKDKVDRILKEGQCKSEDEQRVVLQQQQRKNRLMLNDVTDTYSLVNEMLGQLISLAYLRERDQMYLLLGFYYMTMRNASNWENEIHQAADLEKGRVEAGLVLYQVVSIFDFGLSLPYLDEGGTWCYQQGVSTGLKYSAFYNSHIKSIGCAMRLFGKERINEEAIKIRNYVDHSHYYVDHEKSIIQLYSEFYSGFFWYSRKLKTSVAHNFGTLLERYFLKSDLDYNEMGIQIKTIKSLEFTYKLAGNKTCNLSARDVGYIQEVRDALEFKIQGDILS